MVYVVEYGDNIGTLKNFFKDIKQAFRFVEKVIGWSCAPHKTVGPNKWYCRDKKEYVLIECSE